MNKLEMHVFDCRHRRCDGVKILITQNYVFIYGNYHANFYLFFVLFKSYFIFSANKATRISISPIVL